MVYVTLFYLECTLCSLPVQDRFLKVSPSVLKTAHEICMKIEDYRMNTDFVYNRTLHNLHKEKLGRSQQRKNVSAHVSYTSADWGQYGRKGVNSQLSRGRKNYRVFTHYSRARKRMDGEDVCGSKIKVQFSIPGQDSNEVGNQNRPFHDRKGKGAVI